MSDEEPVPPQRRPGVDELGRANHDTQQGARKVASREWEEGTGYRKRAPAQEQRAEMSRIHQQDEAALQKLRDKKRADAMELMKDSLPSKLGSTSGTTVGMQEARSLLVDKLERESDPVFKRKQRKEQEQKQRDEESEKRKEEEAHRMRNWQERQLRSAARDRDLNKRKQLHWRSMSSASSDGVTAATSDVMELEQDDLLLHSKWVGRWIYGHRQQEYVICESDNGLLSFKGPHPSGGCLTGTLVYQSDADCYEAELKDARGKLFGVMRFCPRMEGGGFLLVSKFRKPGMTDWGKDNFARKANEMAELADVKTAGGAVRLQEDPTPIDVESSRSSGAANEFCPEPRPSYRDKLIDADSDFWQCATCTLINEPAALLCSVCDSARPRHQSSFHVPPTSASNGSAPSLAASCNREVMHHAPGSDTAVPVEVTDERPNEQSDLLSWLTAHRLEMYHPAMVEHGFEELDDLRAAEQSELDEMFDLISVKPGHMLRFRRLLRGGVGSVAKGGPRECPVCLTGEQEGVNVALAPCGHVFCAQHAGQAHKKGTCPVCRVCTKGTQRIFA